MSQEDKNAPKVQIEKFEVMNESDVGDNTFEDIAQRIGSALEAEITILFIGGAKGRGSGIGIRGRSENLRLAPRILRQIADQIESRMSTGKFEDDIQKAISRKNENSKDRWC